MPPPRRLLFGLFPDFELEGRIVETGSTATVEVYRDQFLLSAPGARYVAFATGQPAMPYVLREFYASKLPILRLGGLAIAWHVAVALLPVGLWLAFVLRPLLRVTAVGRPALLATMTGVAMRLLQIAAVVGIVLGARVVIL